MAVPLIKEKNIFNNFSFQHKKHSSEFSTNHQDDLEIK